MLVRENGVSNNNYIMRLIVYCKDCSTKNILKIRATDRVSLKMKYGNEIGSTCKKCNVNSMYEVGDIMAESILGHEILFVITIIFIFLVIWSLWDYSEHPYLLPVGISIPLLIYKVSTNAINDKIRNFNRS